MPKWLKVVLGILVALIVICGLGFGGFAYWVKGKAGDLEATKTEGEAFAKGSDTNGCVVEGLRRMDAEPGLTSEIKHHLFLTFCLKAAPKSAGFCDGVPKPNEFTAMASWALTKCESYGHAKSEPCTRAMTQDVVKTCAGQ